jgi:uncharacterized membrane-anchored protein YhcB (DUF1043 family)
MDKYRKPIALGIGIIILVALGIFVFRLLPNQSSVPANETAQVAIKKAQDLYQQQKQFKTDFSHGPCLSNDLQPDWVADIAHNPRNQDDEYPVNQCQAFTDGRAHHFVELDPQGRLIRTY